MTSALRRWHEWGIFPTFFFSFLSMLSLLIKQRTHKHWWGRWNKGELGCCWAMSPNGVVATRHEKDKQAHAPPLIYQSSILSKCCLEQKAVHLYSFFTLLFSLCLFFFWVYCCITFFLIPMKIIYDGNLNNCIIKGLFG